MATTLTTENLFNGNGSNKDFVITFPYLKEADVKVEHPIGTVLSSGYTFLNATTIRITTAPASGTANVKIYRDTNVDSAKAIFATGSSIRATDLNNNAEQSLFAGQEKVYTDRLTNDSVTTAKIFDEAVTSAKLGDNIDIRGTLDVTGATTLDSTLSVAGAITASSTVDGRDLAADGSKLDGIESGATGNQTNAEIRAAVEAASDSNVFTDADHSKLNAIEASATADQTNAEIRTAVEAASDSNVFTDADHSKLNAIEASATADQTSSEIRTLVEAASDSNVFTDADHSKLNAIEASATADQSASEIRTLVEAASDSNVFTDADHSKLNAIEASATADQTASEIKSLYESNSETNPLTDAEKAVIDGVTANTSELNILDGVTADKDELNLLDGKSIVTTIAANATDAQLPTAQAVNERIDTLQDSFGGFVAVASRTAFPNAHPGPENEADVVVSISDAVGIRVDSSGVATTANGQCTTVGGTAVKISGFPSTLRGGVGSNANPHVLGTGQGLQIVTTTTLNEYTYHKVLANEDGVQNAQSAVNDFNYRYQVSSSKPSQQPDGSALEEGDLWYNTGSNKMQVYDTTLSDYKDIISVGNYDVLGLRNQANNGAASYGSATQFTLVELDSNGAVTSTAVTPHHAAQLVVSVGGVVQQANEGTSIGSLDGYVINGNQIIFSVAPTEPDFIHLLGSTVNIGTPSNNTVTSAMIVDGSIVNADVSNSAAIATSKLSGAVTSIASHGLATSATTDTTNASNISSGTLAAARVATLNQNTTGSAATLTTARTINGVSFNGSANITVADATKMPLAGGTFTGDVTIIDGEEIRIGTSSDLKIFHDASNSVIRNLTGDLYLETSAGSADDIYIKSVDDIWLKPQDGESGIDIHGNGNVKLYYDNSAKLQTYSNGTEVLGNLWLQSGGAYHSDNVKYHFGNGDDLQIYHDGTKNYIKSGASTNTEIWSDTFYVKSVTGSGEAIIKGSANGATELYYDNVKKLSTDSAGIVLTDMMYIVDNKKAVFGDGSDLQIYHSSNINFIDSADTQLIIDSDILRVRSDGGESYLEADANGAVKLYYDNSKKLETFANGIKLYDTQGDQIGEGFDGGFNFTSLVYVDELRLGDSEKIQIGASQDLQIYHQSSNGKNYIASVNNELILQPKSGESGITITPDAGVGLFYNDVKKLETTSTGVKITGTRTDIDTGGTEDCFRIGNAAGCDTGLRIGSTNTNTDTHGVIKYSKSGNWLSLLVSGESHGSHGLMIENGGNVRSDDLIPHSNNAYDLGTSSVRWRNLYINDLQLSNKGSQNSVDGTWGDWTLQEGEEDIFMLNNRSGKKYKMNLTEVG